jgi:RecA-family ATPase
MPHSHDEPFPPLPGDVITPDDERWKRAERKKKGKANGTGADKDPLEALDHTNGIEPRAWTIDDHIPANNVTLLSGEGAVGKSILAQQLAACTALNAISEIDHDWVGLLPKAGPAMVISCEEDANEMTRRLAQIVEHYGTTRKDLLGHLFMYSWVDQTSTQLASLDRRTDSLKMTDLYERVFVTVAQIKPKLIVLDTAADLFGGNEISRNHTRQFIALMRALAIAAHNDASVLLLTHPSLEGIRSGSGLSGSTAWHNSVRARCVFKRIEKADSDEEIDPDLRVLEWRKNNYGPPQDTAMLRYKTGVYVREGIGSNSLEQQLRDRNVEALFLKLLRDRNAQGRNVSDRKGPNYAPAEFANEPEAKNAKPRITSKMLADAMTRLFAAGRLEVRHDGPKWRPGRSIVEKPVTTSSTTT